MKTTQKPTKNHKKHNNNGQNIEFQAGSIYQSFTPLFGAFFLSKIGQFCIFSAKESNSHLSGPIYGPGDNFMKIRLLDRKCPKPTNCWRGRGKLLLEFFQPTLLSMFLFIISSKVQFIRSIMSIKTLLKQTQPRFLFRNRCAYHIHRLTSRECAVRFFFHFCFSIQYFFHIFLRWHFVLLFLFNLRVHEMIGIGLEEGERNGGRSTGGHVQREN